MSDPTTANILLAVPTRGSDPGTWDTPVNSNSSALDGYLGGVQTISVTNAPVTLTAPAGTVSASGGPTQAQNAILSFTGALSANVTVTLPLPGLYIVENLTTGSFLLTFAAAAAGQVVVVDQGESLRLYNNGTNVKFANLPRVGSMEIWAGISAMPAWVNACTVPPYLLCDGSIYNFSTYPYLGKRLAGAFGGNGITTFGVPDLRGRVPLPYDGTGTRITTAGCGLNGQTLGATLDQQTITLVTSQIPSHVHANTLSDPGHSHGYTGPAVAGGAGGGAQGYVSAAGYITAANTTGISINNAAQGGGGAHPNVQPSQVTGIAVIRAA